MRAPERARPVGVAGLGDMTNVLARAEVCTSEVATRFEL